MFHSIEKDEGPPHEKKFACSVKVATSNGILQMLGDEKSRVKDSEQSAASLMITALQECNYLWDLCCNYCLVVWVFNRISLIIASQLREAFTKKID